MLRRELESMEKQELIDLIVEYDLYIRGFDEDLQGCDRTPVCMSEFMSNDYPVILAERENEDKGKKIRAAMLLKMFGGNM